ncbi:MAG: hypothetical protein OEY56_07145 [Cyclobacteriaceae bacterium]|nr:hypothetical protein [Cyclobacteriaceae bacterium]
MENELRNTVKNWLNDNIVFRKLGIHQMFGNDRIYWTFKWSSDYSENLDNHVNPFELLDDRIFDNWRTYSKDDLKIIFEEFQFFAVSKGLKFRKTDIKRHLKLCIENQEFVKIIKFDPKIELLINSERKRVKGTRTLAPGKRSPVNLSQGDTAYICNYITSNMVSPCYIIKDLERTYRVIYFTHLNKNLRETSGTKINGWGFATVYHNEIGTTPEQATANTYN